MQLAREEGVEIKIRLGHPIVKEDIVVPHVIFWAVDVPFMLIGRRWFLLGEGPPT